MANLFQVIANKIMIVAVSVALTVGSLFNLNRPEELPKSPLGSVQKAATHSVEVKPSEGNNTQSPFSELTKDTELRENKKEKEDTPPPTTSPKPLPTPTPSPTPITTTVVTSTPTIPEETAVSVEQSKAPKIVSVSDSLGNTFGMRCWWSETHYECNPENETEPTVSVKKIPNITFTINAKDPNNRPLTYQIPNSGGCREESNSCTFVLNPTTLGLKVFIFYVKNDDNYGSIGFDANTALRYRMSE